MTSQDERAWSLAVVAQHPLPGWSQARVRITGSLISTLSAGIQRERLYIEFLSMF